jgi:RNA polymerase sigma-70 factor (ECF subfamily)
MGAMPQEPFESTRLLESARCGDGAAWEKLIGRYRPYLLAVATRTLGSPRPDELSSVVQEGIVKAFEQIHRFRGQAEAELLGWMAAIVANKARDRRRAKPTVPLPQGREEDEALLAASDSAPSAVVLRRERAVRVLAAKALLPPDYQRVIDMRFFENAGYDEIAAALGRTNDAVRCLCMRALRRLRDELGEEP